MRSLLLAVLLAATPALPQEAHLLPTERCGEYFLVQAMVNGDPEKVLSLLLDTGAEVTIVDPDSLERVSGQRIEPRKWTRFAELTVGELRFKRLRAQALEFDHLQRILGKPMDGILGFHAFRDLLLVLDYPAGEVRAQIGALPEPDGRTVLPLVKKRGRPWIKIDFGTVTRAVLIDSGSSGGLTIPSIRRLEWQESPRPIRGAVRINRIEMRRVGRLAHDALLGTTRLPRPTAEVTEGTPVLGTDVLRYFVVTIDARRRRVRFERDVERAIEFPPIRSTGLLLDPRPEGFRVIRAFDGLSASRAGVLEHDLIVAIDGTPVYERDLCDRDGPHGTSQRLTIERAGKRLDLDVPVDVVVP